MHLGQVSWRKHPPSTSPPLDPLQGDADAPVSVEWNQVDLIIHDHAMAGEEYEQRSPGPGEEGGVLYVLPHGPQGRAVMDVLRIGREKDNPLLGESITPGKGFGPCLASFRGVVSLPGSW